MTSPELERLVSSGLLDREAPIRAEYDGLVREASVLLQDAGREDLSPESRFRLAYGAAHAIAVAALRRLGYRPRNRQVVFQALAHTMGAPAATWRLLSRGHEQRNRREYEGAGEITESLLRDLFAASESLLAQLKTFPPPDEKP